MWKNSPVHTIALPWRKVVCAVVFIGGGIALTAQAAPAPNFKEVAVREPLPAHVAPDIGLTRPALRELTSANPAVPETPALVLPVGILPGSSTPVTLDSTGIPIRALAGYRRAVSLIYPADPGCHIDWALLAAIGRVESDHARFGGNKIDAAGVARPGIIGMRLDGSNGTARITDSDSGRLDGDTVFDRAVGPMQFLPGTWRVVGTDADGDGVKNPEDMADAATSAAIYLCSGHGNLSQPGDLRAAIMRYNASESYARTVTAIADAYRHGVTALPAAALPAARPPGARTPETVVAVRLAGETSAAATALRGSTPESMIRANPAATPGTPAPIPSISTAAAQPSTITPAPTATLPPLTVVTTLDPCLPLPTTTATDTVAPSPTVTEAPNPTVPAGNVPCLPLATSSPKTAPTAAP
jgi:hypothetical protein